MKSSVIQIDRQNEKLNEILNETQRTASYATLNTKQALRLRLLAEELVGMLKELSGAYEGEFYIEYEALCFALVTRLRINQDMDAKTKKGFIDVSSDKKNAAAKGVMGKIRDVVENIMYPENAQYSVNAQREGDILLDGSWSLSKYINDQRGKEEPWDEIEKSIIANLADNVDVSVKGKNVEIVITKKFA